MVFIQLILMARTENVSAILMPEGSDWHLNVRCTHCNEKFAKQVTISILNQHEVVKQIVNFHSKCKNCNRKGTIKITDKSVYKAEPGEDGQVKTVIAVMDCRGLDIDSVELGNSMTVVTDAGTEFENADFTDLWAEQDEKTDKLIQVEDPEIVLNKIK